MEQVCTSFSRTGQCVYGDFCLYKHVRPDELNQSVVAMDISTGIYQSMEQSVEMSDAPDTAVREVQEELERTWGHFLKKVKLTAVSGFSGSTNTFRLDEIGSVMASCSPNTLDDPEQIEELTLFRLSDGRCSSVYVAHCNPKTCCGVCIFSLYGYVGPTPNDVCLALPEKMRVQLIGQ